MTEKTIQNALSKDLILKKNELVVPNTKLYAWEADLLAVSTSGLVSEYEIKISRSDFKADKKKEWKHAVLAGKKTRGGGKRPYVLKPSYFYYVAPAGLLDVDEIADYAGFIEIGAHGLRLIRRAPRHHTIKLNDGQRKFLGRGLMYRYWNTRI